MKRRSMCSSVSGEEWGVPVKGSFAVTMMTMLRGRLGVNLVCHRGETRGVIVLGCEG